MASPRPELARLVSASDQGYAEEDESGPEADEAPTTPLEAFPPPYSSEFNYYDSEGSRASPPAAPDLARRRKPTARIPTAGLGTCAAGQANGGGGGGSGSEGDPWGKAEGRCRLCGSGAWPVLMVGDERGERAHRSCLAFITRSPGSDSAPCAVPSCPLGPAELGVECAGCSSFMHYECFREAVAEDEAAAFPLHAHHSPGCPAALCPTCVAAERGYVSDARGAASALDTLSLSNSSPATAAKPPSARLAPPSLWGPRETGSTYQGPFFERCGQLYGVAGDPNLFSGCPGDRSTMAMVWRLSHMAPHEALPARLLGQRPLGVAESDGVLIASDMLRRDHFSLWDLPPRLRCTRAILRSMARLLVRAHYHRSTNLDKGDGQASQPGPASPSETVSDRLSSAGQAGRPVTCIPSLSPAALSARIPRADGWEPLLGTWLARDMASLARRQLALYKQLCLASGAQAILPPIYVPTCSARGFAHLSGSPLEHPTDLPAVQARMQQSALDLLRHSAPALTEEILLDPAAPPLPIILPVALPDPALEVYRCSPSSTDSPGCSRLRDPAELEGSLGVRVRQGAAVPAGRAVAVYTGVGTAVDEWGGGADLAAEWRRPPTEKRAEESGAGGTGAAPPGAAATPATPAAAPGPKPSRWREEVPSSLVFLEEEILYEISSGGAKKWFPDPAAALMSAGRSIRDYGLDLDSLAYVGQSTGPGGEEVLEGPWVRWLEASGGMVAPYAALLSLCRGPAVALRGTSLAPDPSTPEWARGRGWPTRSGLGSPGKLLSVSALGFAGDEYPVALAGLMNDPRGYTDEEGQPRCPNVTIVPIFVQGHPVLVVYAVKDIAEGQPLLFGYGGEYWADRGANTAESVG